MNSCSVPLAAALLMSTASALFAGPGSELSALGAAVTAPGSTVQALEKEAKADLSSAAVAKDGVPKAAEIRKSLEAERTKAMAEASKKANNAEEAVKAAEKDLAAAKDALAKSMAAAEVEGAPEDAVKAAAAAKDAVKAAETKLDGLKKSAAQAKDELQKAETAVKNVEADAAAQAKAGELIAKSEAKDAAEEKAKAAKAKAAAEEKAAQVKAAQTKADAVAAKAKKLKDERAAERQKMTAAKAKAMQDLTAKQNAVKAAKDELAKAKSAKKPDAAIKGLKDRLSAAEKEEDAARDALDSAKKGLRDAEKSFEAAERDANRKVEAAEAEKKSAAAAEKREKEKREADERKAKEDELREKRKAAKNSVSEANREIKRIDSEREKANDQLKALKGGKIKNPKETKKQLEERLEALEKSRRDAVKKLGDGENELKEIDQKIDAERATTAITHVFKTDDRLSDRVVSNRLSRVQGNFAFSGDTKWLAGTSVDGKPLLRYFEETSDPVVAVSNATVAAVNGGFYFAGFSDQETGKPVTTTTRKILVDKGRVGPIEVSFLDSDTQVGVDAKVFRSEQIKRSMGVEEGGVFNYNDIQKRFIQLNGDPDIQKVNIAFTPGVNYKGPISDYTYDDKTSTAGNRGRLAAMKIKVYEKEDTVPLHGVFAVDNYTSLGDMDSVAGDADAWTARLTLQFLHLWHSDHSFTLTGLGNLGGSIWGGAASYMIPRTSDAWLSPLGWTWTLHGGYTDVDQDEVVPQIDVEGTGYFGGLQASKRVRTWTSGVFNALDFSFGATYRHVDSALVLDNNGQKQRLEMGDGDGYDIIPLSVALSLSNTGLDSCGGRNYLTLEGIYNLGGSDLRELQSFRTAIEDEDYWLLRAQIARLQLLGAWDGLDDERKHCWFLFLRAEGQYADSPVVGSEQFGMGGHGSLRGYAERQFLGDTGLSGTIELRTPIYVASDRGWRFQGVLPFFDAGRYTLKKGLNGTEDDEETLLSVGAGFRLAYGDGFLLRVDYGYPINPDEDRFDVSESGRFCISASLQF